MDTEIKKWGNSAVVRIPAALMAQLELEVGTPVKLNAEDGRIVIEPATKRRLRPRRAGGGHYARQST